MKELWKRTLRALCLLLLTAFMTMQNITVYAADTPASAQYAYVTNQSVYFYDVTADYDWAFHQIDYLATVGVAKGTGQYLFEPDAGMTRADFVLMLYRAYGMSSYATSGTLFPDVPADAYYADAVRAARSLGITSGDDGKFLPNAPISRQDAMVLLLRTLERAGYEFANSSLDGFVDVANIDDYASDPIGKLVAAEVIGGDEQGRLAPLAGVTRAEMSVMLYRAMMIENSTTGPHYVAHPGRVNVCIGDKIYSGATIVDYDSKRNYAGLMTLLDFNKTDSGYEVKLGASEPIDKQITWSGGKLFINGSEVPVAESCLSIQVAPYCALDSLQSTGGTYSAGEPAFNDKGEVVAVYYQRA